MKRPVQQQECAPARWARALGGALLLWAVLLTGARAEGRVVLGNGAAVEWRVEATEADPRLGLAIPAFTRWTREGFEDPVAIAVRSDALAAIDAWDVSFYRLGDTDFSRPVWRKRGTGATFGDPLEWDGVAASGPPLRPGETVVARLSVRDVAGNIDRAEPQEMLVARYIMSRERRAVSTLDAARQRALPEGEAVEQVPLRGYALILTVTDWPDAAGPGASGARFQQKGDDWVLRQILPSGPHDIVVQSLRPIMGGTRAIPVGVVTVEIPSVSPFHAQIKGTGALDKGIALWCWPRMSVSAGRCDHGTIRVRHRGPVVAGADARARRWSRPNPACARPSPIRCRWGRSCSCPMPMTSNGAAPRPPPRAALRPRSHRRRAPIRACWAGRCSGCSAMARRVDRAFMPALMPVSLFPEWSSREKKGPIMRLLRAVPVFAMCLSVSLPGAVRGQSVAVTAADISGRVVVGQAYADPARQRKDRRIVSPFPRRFVGPCTRPFARCRVCRYRSL